MTLPRLMIAPNGATRTKADHPALPVTIAEIIAATIACVGAGADGLHAHVRDAAGRHVLDAGLYSEFLAEMRVRLPGLYVQITTEAVGRYTPAEQRAVVAAVQPGAVSVALREMMAGDEKAARDFYHDCAAADIEVQHILYDSAEVDRLAGLVGRGVIPGGRLAILHVLGRYASGQISTLDDINAPLARQSVLGPAVDWAVCAFGPAETAILAEVLRRGGKARIGFENNLLQPDGQPAQANAARVATLNAMVEARLPLN